MSPTPAEERTAAMSNDHEVTLAHDPSRQYLRDSRAGVVKDSRQDQRVAARRYQQSQIIPNSLSLSQVTASHAHLSEMNAVEVLDSGLYGRKAKGGTHPKTRVQALSLSATTTAARKYEDTDWKKRRRQSEQVRVNLETGKPEQIDMLMERKNNYLALKQKYAGRDSDIA